MRQRTLGTGIVLVVAAVLAGCGRGAAQGPGPGGAAEVSYVTLKTRKAVLSSELPGRTTAYLVAEIRPQVSGLVRSRLFREGTDVKAGDVLYQIEPAPYQAAFNQAKAAQAAAEAELVTAEANLPALRSRAERLKVLAASRAVGQQDADDASAALRQAEAALAARRAAVEVSRAAVETARINLGFTPIVAPISGRVGVSGITVGALATAHQPAALAVVQQLDPIYVDVAQANADVLRLRRSLEGGAMGRGASGGRVKLVLEDGSAYRHAGSLQFRDVTVDPTTGSMTLRMVFPNPERTLLPGMYVRAVVEEGVSEHALMAPQQGVTRDRRGLPTCLVVTREGVVEMRTLELDRAIGDEWLVKSGLAEGDKVIVEGMQRVRPGDKVKAVEFKQVKGGAHV